MFEPRGSELIQRNKSNYSIPDEADVSVEMILHHWELEKKLTKELLKSNRDNRWEIFDSCYTTLYRNLDWLNAFAKEPTTEPEFSTNYGSILLAQRQRKYMK